MREYRASGKFSLVGLLPLLLITVLGGALLGGILFAIDNFTGFYLVLIFPIGAAVLAAGIMGWAVQVGKCRNGFVALIFGVLIGVLIYFTYHFGLYAYNDRERALRRVDFEELTISERLQVEWGEFAEWLEERAEDGMQITRGASSSGIPIQGTGMWIYWGLELLAAVIGGALGAVGAASMPFNERTGKWFDTRNEQFVGNLRDGLRNDFLNKLKSGDVGGAGALLTTDQLQMPYIAVTVQRGDLNDLEAESIVIVRRYKPGRSNTETEEVFDGVATTAQVDQLTRAVTGNMPTAPMPGALPLM